MGKKIHSKSDHFFFFKFLSMDKETYLFIYNRNTIVYSLLIQGDRDGRAEIGIEL